MLHESRINSLAFVKTRRACTRRCRTRTGFLSIQPERIPELISFVALFGTCSTLLVTYLLPKRAKASFRSYTFYVIWFWITVYFTLTARLNYGKDTMLDDYRHKFSVRGLIVQPNLFVHIGFLSSLSGKLLDPSLMYYPQWFKLF